MRRLSLGICAVLASCSADDGTTSSSGDPFGNGSSTVTGSTGGSLAGGAAGGSAGGTAGGNTTPAPSSNDNTMSGVCEVKTVGTGRVAPDILIVLDRSGSMRMGGVNRWDPSVAAIKTVTSRFQTGISFGLMAFPGTAAGMQPAGMTPTNPLDCLSAADPVSCFAAAGTTAIGDVASCAAGTLNVPIQPNSAAAIASALDGMQPNGATPTAASLQAAHTLLKGQAGPDDQATAKYVLLVTDGAPNCAGGNNARQDGAAVQMTVGVIDQMAKDGIKTFVVGYGTQSDAQLKAALDQMAQAGGTGDKAHRAIEDEQGLVTTFEQITGTLLSCEFKLKQSVANKSFVKVTFDGKQLNVDDANGWLLSADRTTVTLQGDACALAKEGGHTISVSVECQPVIPL